MKRHAFHPEAAREYAEIARYYSKIEGELGSRFYDEMERLIVEVREDPKRFRFFEGTVRRHFSTVFPHAILYLDEPDRISIVAVMDMRRKPGYWKERID